MKTIIFISGFLFCFSTYAQKVNLQLNLQKGHAYSQMQNSKMVMAQNINSQRVITNVEITAKTNFYVKDVRDSVFVIDVSYESLKTKMTNGQMQFEINSADEKQDPASGILRAMVNKPFSMVMTRTGKILQIKVDSLFSSVLNEIQAPEEQKKLAAEQLKQYFSESAAKGSFEMLYAIYPDKPVKTGDQWPVQMNMQGVGYMNVSGVYIFKGQTEIGSVIHGELNMVSEKDSTTEVNGMKMNYDLSGTLVTDYILDKKSGWITSGKSTQALKGTVKIKESDQLPEGMTILMSMNTETELSEK